MDWLKQIAPTAATLLGGPLAGMAVDAIGKALNISDATKDQVKGILTSGTLNADQMAAIKQAEADLVLKVKQLDIDMEKVHAGDRASARDMATKTGDIWTPRIIAIIVFVVWVVVQFHVLNKAVPTDARELVIRMLGTLDAVLMAVVYYYFGSSSGSAAKTAAMAEKK